MKTTEKVRPMQSEYNGGKVWVERSVCYIKRDDRHRGGRIIFAKMRFEGPEGRYVLQYTSARGGSFTWHTYAQCQVWERDLESGAIMTFVRRGQTFKMPDLLAGTEERKVASQTLGAGAGAASFLAGVLGEERAAWVLAQFAAI